MHMANPLLLIKNAHTYLNCGEIAHLLVVYVHIRCMGNILPHIRKSPRIGIIVNFFSFAVFNYNLH